MGTNYFVCTLGQASRLQRTEARSIPEFLKLQSQTYGNFPAVGFAYPDGHQSTILGFDDLDRVTDGAARELVAQTPRLKSVLGQKHVVALLGHSNLSFLKAWLGLIKLGFSVLLLAPQLDKPSIEALCSQEKVSFLFHDHSHRDISQSVAGPEKIEIGLFRELRLCDEARVEESLELPKLLPDIPYLHHSSGTSSGKPKAIPQSNKGSFISLPSLSPLEPAACFSSTPLYHGGVADCFRAWTSGQMIWLFPGGHSPITGQNVAACVRAADQAASVEPRLRIRYFSSVPYVLRDLADTAGGLEILCGMQIVGVGGAAFPPELGKELVEKGTCLVSRYGSAECGFILSSNRTFESDDHWDFLRSEETPEFLSFEPQDNGLFELIVKPGWPHMAKTNRPDGSFATADLFEKHSTIANAWRYHSRADAQIVLISGKKFDPEPIESAVLARSSHLIEDFLVVGKDETLPGGIALVQQNRAEHNPELREQIWKILSEVNANSPTHARVSKDMLSIILLEGAPTLEKSSKGTILRGKANARYQTEINNLYREPTDPANSFGPIKSRSELVEAVTHIVAETTSKSLSETDDFYERGIDSVACVQARKRIDGLWKQLKLREKKSKGPGQNTEDCRLDIPIRDFDDLPVNLLYDCGTIGGVVDFLLAKGTWEQDDEVEMMAELAETYGRFDFAAKGPNSHKGRPQPRSVVLLTGATGALGTHILDTLRSRPTIARIYCLLRASDKSAARARVDKALKSKARKELSSSDLDSQRIVCIPCNLAQDNLGIDENSLEDMKGAVDLIIHAAWAVNFTLKLKTFDFHLAGVMNLLNFGVQASQSVKNDRPCRSVKFQFCSSIASVAASSLPSVREELSHDPHDSSPLGYSRSKWVAEMICQRAQTVAARANIPLEVDIVRIGQLCGDQKHGIWNTSEAWPLMLSSYDVCSALPNIPNETLSWLPVDIAATSIVELAEKQGDERIPQDEAQVFHVLNAYHTPTWAQMLECLSNDEGDKFRKLSPKDWVAALEKDIKLDHPNHPSGKLLDLWKSTYLSHSESAKERPTFEVLRATQGSQALANLAPLSPELIRRMWRWIRENISADG